MAVVMRAIVMLVVLVGVPATWVYYGPLPPQAQGVIDRVVDVAKSAIGWEQPVVAGADSVVAPYYDPAVIPAMATESVSTGPISVAQLKIERAETAELAVAPTPTPAALTLQEQVAPLLQQLQDQGASEYTLEKWGNDGRFYRFCCAMPLMPEPLTRGKSLASSNQVTQQFEAIHTGPGEAIQQVLAEVTSWKTARLNQTQFSR